MRLQSMIASNTLRFKVSRTDRQMADDIWKLDRSDEEQKMYAACDALASYSVGILMFKR